MKAVPKDDDWRIFTYLMYDMIDTLAGKPEEVAVKMNAHEARLQKEDDSEAAVIFPKLRTKIEKWNLKQTRKSR
jgi:hypothetical protein